MPTEQPISRGSFISDPVISDPVISGVTIRLTTILLERSQYFAAHDFELLIRELTQLFRSG
jgi:hypothetical protein